MTDETQLNDPEKQELARLRQRAQHNVDLLGKMLADLLQRAGIEDRDDPAVVNAQTVLNAALSGHGDWFYAVGVLSADGVSTDEIHEAANAPMITPTNGFNFLVPANPN